MKKVGLEYTWRWFGPDDRITLADIGQTGATGIVSALHQIPVGEVWPLKDIIERKNLIESYGLSWCVVESLPVSEDIKKQSGDFFKHIENYKSSLINLSRCGIKTICYNFMPVLDWSRTNLNFPFPDGSFSLKYEYHKFAAFDIFMLKRLGAENEYPAEVVNKATNFFNELNPDGRKKLQSTILLGLPGSLREYTPDELKAALGEYKNIDKAQLKENLKFFLEQIIPVAEAEGVKMAIHPDDPPWPLLGLPRIVCNYADLKEIIESVPSPSNGITLCTGSLGAGYFNDLPEIAEKLADKIHFAHLRNVYRDENLDFLEKNLFEGDVNIVRVVSNLLNESKRRNSLGQNNSLIPIRPDHGSQMLGDIGKENYPGYGLYGRMKSLAEIRGLEAGLLSI